jgi:hypothetical protein
MTDPQSGEGPRHGVPAVLQTGAPLVLTPAQKVRDEAAPGPDGTPRAAPLNGDAALRQMVRDILAEELRGEFGARITRDVRAEVRTLMAT